MTEFLIGVTWALLILCTIKYLYFVDKNSSS